MSKFSFKRQKTRQRSPSCKKTISGTTYIHMQTVIIPERKVGFDLIIPLGLAIIIFIIIIFFINFFF